MPNGHEFIDEMALEAKMKPMSDRELSEFIARQMFDFVNQCYECQEENEKQEVRISNLESRSNKQFAVSGGVGGSLGAALMVVAQWVISLFTK